MIKSLFRNILYSYTPQSHSLCRYSIPSISRNFSRNPRDQLGSCTKNQTQNITNEFSNHLPANILQAIENAVQRSMSETTKRRYLFGAALFLLTGGAVFNFWDDIKGKFSLPVSEVATEAIGVKEFQLSVEELGKAIVKQVLYDEIIRKHATEFVEDLLAREDTRQAFSEIVVRVIKSPEFRKQADIFSKDLVNRLLDETSIISGFERLVGYAISTPENQMKWLDLMHFTAADEDFRKSLQSLSEHTVHEILNSKEVNKHMEQFVEELMQSSEVQSTGGDALWNVIKAAFTPSFVQDLSKGGSISDQLTEKNDDSKNPLPHFDKTSEISKTFTNSSNVSSNDEHSSDTILPNNRQTQVVSENSPVDKSTKTDRDVNSEISSNEKHSPNSSLSKKSRSETTSEISITSVNPPAEIIKTPTVQNDFAPESGANDIYSFDSQPPKNLLPHSELTSNESRTSESSSCNEFVPETKMNDFQVDFPNITDYTTSTFSKGEEISTKSKSSSTDISKPSKSESMYVTKSSNNVEGNNKSEISKKQSEDQTVLNSVSESKF